MIVQGEGESEGSRFQIEDLTAGCLLDYNDTKHHYRLIALNLSR